MHIIDTIKQQHSFHHHSPWFKQLHFFHLFYSFSSGFSVLTLRQVTRLLNQSAVLCGKIIKTAFIFQLRSLIPKICDYSRQIGERMDTKKTGELIRKKRLELNLTQQELADRLFITPSTISKYENGRGFPDTSLLEPLSDALGLSINEILKAC
ncbi:MAG: helix-turn-helix transcriptional regulator [Solobacterium sp.]|nr:helix-turn-helix transcriptional regulator [Solobacterium sp.]